ncbi:hypothetical protein E2P81_ATG01491 [Venturia nashicola]|uniref:Uncharacterized protein n=1 Tax=Venturia nashicola TaxID=86259 RepID=A0A4Z1PSB3_9PEZI|nr:hypothetical protein E6O75_ATG01528 [Venturia nashicola]TLD38948.1 hypothetical protein E2P81_ATG01491 [Venturia nashicola]
MLSRPHSNAANQLRRTKSSSTVIQRRSSASSLIDPVAAKQHAIVAATLAYERAHGKENHGASCVEQPVKVAGRRSHRARRSEGEGSHFDASRTTPRRQTSKRLSNASHVQNDNIRARRGAMSSIDSGIQHSSHVRAQSELQNNMSRYVDESAAGSSATPFQQIRRSKSMYNTSSGHARTTTIDSISFARTPRQTSISHTDETVSSIQEHDEPITEVIPPVPPITLSQTAIYNVDDKLQKARDQHFQDLQKKKIRQRASFILTPFKKRNENTSLSSITGNGVTYDNGPPLPIPSRPKEERKFSDEMKSSGSLRNKIRKVFRRSSTTPLVLPVQHVEASRAHYGEDFANQLEAPSDQPSLPKAINSTPISSAGNSRSASPIRSSQTNESRSRVTSWADSTAAGSVASREGKALAVIHEDAPQPAPSTRSRKFSSLGIFRRSRKSSAASVPEPPKPGPTECETANGDPFQDSAVVSQSFQAGLKRSGTVYDTLPSQARRISGHSSRASFSIKPTIRSVPSDSGGNLSSRSCSSRLAHTSTNQLIHHDDGSSEEESTLDLTVKRLRNRLQKSRKEEPAKPTADQIADRVEKSNERWKQPLDHGRSIFYPRSPQGVSPERLMRASEQLGCSPMLNVSAPEIVPEPVQEPPTVTRSMGVISPSIYSQNTNSSPTRLQNDSAVSLEPSNRHAVVVGTAVINPSLLAGKYSIGSETKGMIPRLAKTSRDWKAWLSKEVEELEVQPAERFTLSSEYLQAPSNSGHRREHAQVVDGEDVTIGAGTNLSSSIPIPSIEPLPIPRPLQQRSRNVSEETASIRETSLPPSLSSSRPRLDRPRLIDRPSSRMNERFPFIETRRPPSRSSRRSSRKSTPPESLPPPLVKKENTNSSSMLAVPAPQLRRPPLRKPTSISSFQRSTSSLAQYTTNTSATASNTSINQIHRSTSHIPRPSATSLSGVGANKAAGSTGNLHNRSTSALSSTRPALPKAMTAPPSALAGPNFDTDPTLAAIFKGPYRENSVSPVRPRALAVRKAPSHSQLLRQQSTPHMARESSSTMPREVSSLRRAESSSILRDGQISAMLRAQSLMSMKENCSPARSLSVREDSAASTPTRGQILAQRFLEERRIGGGSRQSMGYGESSPASPRFI